MAEAIEKYITEEGSYRAVAGELCGASYRPAHSQVWQWVELFVSRVQEFLGLDLQRACIELDKDEKHLLEAGSRVCRNAENASQEKATKLNFAASALAMAELLLSRKADLIRALQTRFVQNVHSPLSVLTGRGIRLLAPQSSKHAY